ncbi:hypothetical protein CVS40_11056 [Lucilia cuprina]|nr:hypothetical protein CVS40_11056 [Lucilia cuprina]
MLYEQHAFLRTAVDRCPIRVIYNSSYLVFHGQLLVIFFSSFYVLHRIQHHLQKLLLFQPINSLAIMFQIIVPQL